MYYTQEEFDKIIEEMPEEINVDQLSSVLHIYKRSRFMTKISELLSPRIDGRKYWYKKENVIALLEENRLFFTHTKEYMTKEEIDQTYGDIWFKHDPTELREKVNDIIYFGSNRVNAKFRREEVVSFYEERKERIDKLDSLSSNPEIKFMDIYNSPKYMLSNDLEREINSPRWYIYHLIKEGVLEKSVCFGNKNSTTYVHIEEVEKIKELYGSKEVFGDFYSFEEDVFEINEPYDYFLKVLVKFSIEESFPETHSLYDLFIQKQLSTTKAYYKDLQAQLYSNSYKTLSRIITKEVPLMNDKEVSFLFGQDIMFGHKETLLLFFKFVAGKVRTTYSVLPRLKKAKGRRQPMDAYPKEQFYSMYNRVNNLELHLQNSIEDYSYAQRWFFLTMAFSNAWRTPDISAFPSPSLPVINGEEVNLEWFKTNHLNFQQSAVLLKRIQTEISFTINKTGLLNELILPNDILISMANALVVTELHRREKGAEFLLSSFQHMSPNHKTFRRFFKNDGERFSMLRTTKALLTYSYLTASDMEKHAGVANAMVSRMRGHKEQNSILHYIAPTTMDGAEASNHLFRRGHFGFLYSLLVDLSLNGARVTVNEKTEMIENLVNVYSPKELDELGGYFLKRKNSLLSVVDEVSQMTQEEAKEKVVNIYNGNMPSYELESQCFVSGNCIKPNRDCASCKYLIPKINYLKTASTQLFDNLSELKETAEGDKVKRIKLTVLIGNTLSLLNEAVVNFGKEYVTEYIDLNELRKQLETVNSKMLEVR